MTGIRFLQSANFICKKGEIMFILFEMRKAGDQRMSNWDAMGYATTEQKAKEWVALKPEYRCYKYCSDSKYD